MISIIDEIGMVVQAMRDSVQKPIPAGTFKNAYDPASIIPPFYYSGRRKEIVNSVADKGKLNVVSFPLIALNGDVEYTRRGNLIDYKLNLLIAVSTTADLTTPEREDTNYVPVLYPMYDLFISCFNKIGLFMWDATKDAAVPPHTPVNRYYYGTSSNDGNVKNMFDEPVDAIELVNFEFSKQLN